MPKPTATPATTRTPDSVLADAEAVLERLETAVSKTTTQLDATVKPVRRQLSRRFPTLFLFLVVVGATATVLGIEQLLLQYALLERYPWLILTLGLSLLALTGTLYKKLG